MTRKNDTNSYSNDTRTKHKNEVCIHYMDICVILCSLQLNKGLLTYGSTSEMYMQVKVYVFFFRNKF